MSAGGDVYDVQDYSIAAANGHAFGMIPRGLLDVGAGPVASSRGYTSVGSPANRFNPSHYTQGGAMTKTNLRTLAFYLAVGAAVTFAVAHLAPIRGR